MLNCLTILTNSHTKEITSSAFRRFILALSDNFEDELKSKINFHICEEAFSKDFKSLRVMPHVLFGKPCGKAFRIYAYGSTGMEILLKIEKELRFKILLSGKTFKVLNTFIVEKDFMPKRQVSKLLYNTATPILLFTKNERKIYDGIYNKHKNNYAELNKVLIPIVNQFIKTNIKYQISQIIKEKDYKIFDEINIEWKEFKTIFVKNRDKVEIGIVGTFETNWILPQFIGRNIGTGFGEIRASKKKNRTKEIVISKAS